MTETAQLIQQIRDPNNWTDDLFTKIESFYAEHFNAIRNTLTNDKLWDRFDTAFSEWKKPGQVALFQAEQENNSGFGGFVGFGNGSMEQKSQYSDGFACFSPLEQDQNLQLPPFPVECLPDEVRRYAEALAESLQVPVEKATSEPVFEYMAEENERRSGDIEEYKLQKSVLTEKLKTLKINFSKNKSTTMQDIKDCQADLDELKEVKPLKLVMDDVTPESLAKTMSENGERMGIFSAEGGLFGMLAGRYSDNCNIDLFLKSYTGEYYASSRITRQGEELRHPLLTLGLSVQPKVIEDIMNNEQFRGRGLLARFLYSVPKSLVGSRRYRTDPTPPEVTGEYKELIKCLLEMLNNNTVIKLSDEAFLVSENFFETIESKLDGEYKEIEDWAGKLYGNTMRIAGLLHVVKHTFDPGGILLEKAIEIGKYFLEHSRTAFDIMGLSDPPEVRDAKYIISKIDAITKTNKITRTFTNPAPLSKRDFIKNHSKYKTIEEAEPGLQVLIEHGYIAVVKGKSSAKDGRPLENIIINPEYLAWRDRRNR